MRNPKRGDRCEYAVMNPKTYRKDRICEIRHLEGAPPGLLMAVKQGRESVLVCNLHAQELHGGSIDSLTAHAVKRQKKVVIRAEQVGLFS